MREMAAWIARSGSWMRAKGALAACATLGFAALTACHGNGITSGMGNNNGGGGGASEQDIARGTITGFGSVFLNGTPYDTTDATFTRDGVDVTQDDLSVGMVVKIRDIGSHTADRVEYVEDVLGPVDIVLPNGLLVMGQVVSIDATTTLDPSFDPATVAAGDIVEVSGLRDATDEIVASFVATRQAADAAAFTVLGLIHDLDAGTQTFGIGGLTVDYSAATFTDFTAGNLANGQLVQVSDASKAQAAGASTLVATGVDYDSFVRMEDNDGFGQAHSLSDEARVEGLVTRVVDSMHLVVSGVPVTLSNATTFGFGDASDLVVGQEVEAHGTLAVDGTLTASRIVLLHNATRVAGTVDAVDVAGGTVQIFGVTVAPRIDARLTDTRDGTTPFGLGDVSTGDFLDARGVEHDATIIGHEVVRETTHDTRLRGSATSIDTVGHALSILGVPVVTDANTQYLGPSAANEGNEATMTVDDFFAALHDGQTAVEARWTGAVTDPATPAAALSIADVEQN